MSTTYLTTEQLSERIHYDARTIRNQLKDSVLLEGKHYIRPFGRRKLLFIWEAIERDLGVASDPAFGRHFLNPGPRTTQPFIRRLLGWPRPDVIDLLSREDVADRTRRKQQRLARKGAAKPPAT